MAETVVRAWMQAFEARDVDRLLALTSPDLDYARWTGVERGHDAVRGLLERQTYGVAMHPQALRFFGRDEAVVVEVRIVGRYVDTGEVAAVDPGAAAFVVRDGLVVHYAPQPSLAQALAHAGLDKNDQIPDEETEMQDQSPLVVAVHGATGTQGAPLVRRLLRAGHRVRGAVRHPSREAGLPPGCEPFACDLSDAGALARAYAGADVVVVQLPLVFDERAMLQAELVAGALERSEVGRVVFNPGGPVSAAPVGVPYLDARRTLVRALQDGPYTATVVEPIAPYMENLSAPWSAPLVRRGVLAYPLPADMPIPWVAIDDVAELMAAAVAGGPQRRLSIGGPRALNGAGAANALGAALGHPVRWETIDPAQYGAAMRPHTGSAIAAGTAGLYALLTDGPRPPALNPAALRIGRTDLEAWARGNSDLQRSILDETAEHHPSHRPGRDDRRARPHHRVRRRQGASGRLGQDR